MLKKKKSFYFGVHLVKKLSGICFYRLGIYSKNKLVDVIGYLFLDNNILFINFSVLYYYIYRGFDFISFKGLIGRNFRDINLGSILIMGLFNWLFISKRSSYLNMPKKFWLKYLNRVLYIVYYLVFRNIIELKDFKFDIKFKLSKILFKRFLIVKKLDLLRI